MEHVVFFPAQDGSPAFRRLPTLDEAVRLVEHLRNVEGVSQVSCHALTEVPLAFKAYYRVEVPTAEVPTAEVPAEAAPVPVLEQAPELSVPVLVAPDVLPEVVPDPVPDPVADASLVLEPPAVVVPEQPAAEAPEVPAEPAAVSSLGFFSR